MKFEPKMSGTRVSDFNITPIFCSQIVWLSEAMEVIQNAKTMDTLLTNFVFTKGCEEKANDWGTILDHDTIMKLSVLENYPEYEKEFIEYFGENWFKHYIRFNH